MAEAWGWGPADLEGLNEAELMYLEDLYRARRESEKAARR